MSEYLALARHCRMVNEAGKVYPDIFLSLDRKRKKARRIQNNSAHILVLFVQACFARACFTDEKVAAFST